MSIQLKALESRTWIKEKIDSAKKIKTITLKEPIENHKK